MHDSPSPTLLSRFVSWWRKIGGGSLTLSLAIHGAILLFASLLLIQITQKEQPVDFIPRGTTVQSQAATSELKKTKQAQREKTRDRMTRERIVSSAPTARFVLPVEPMKGYLPSPDYFPTGPGDDIGGPKGPGIDTFGNPRGGDNTPFRPLALPSLISARCNSRERLQKLRDNGGSAQCERAVSNSLEWLKTKQNADGSWGRSHKAAMTGFALLCYLGRCETPDSPFYGDTVMKGILYLIELAKKNPQGVFAENASAHAATYEHGIATYALGETYTLAKLGSRQLPGLREAFERGVQVIVTNQLPDGGWGYGDDFCYRNTGPGDLSVTGWQFQALKAAHYSGLKFDRLHKSIDRAVDYLASKQSKEGGFGGTNREQGYNQWNLTGVGLLGLQTLGKGHSREIKRGVQFVQDFVGKEPPSWKKNANLYTWYYLAQSLFQHGGEPWQEWNRTVLPQLLENQNSDGSWKAETPDSSIASTSPAGADRDLYRTTLCTLMLEVYYRYLKVGDRETDSIFQR